MNTWKKELASKYCSEPSRTISTINISMSTTTNFHIIQFYAVLQKSKFRAQEKGDLKEESKVCNAIGELYFQNG